MNSINKKILVTCALPYANGPIHLGHMLEHIQADIWVRYHRMRGHEIYFICADDAHGTPIMLKSQELGILPEEMVSQIQKEHEIDFFEFNISYDHYCSTHSEENRHLSEMIYLRLKRKGFIKQRIISQFYDPKNKIFLPDRFVKGTCPQCKSLDQYGDNCENCGATYSTMQLINPKSVLSNLTPEIRHSKHFFFNLPLFTTMLKKWIFSGVLPVHIANKVQEWFQSGLQEWDISRDQPYFGFEIPNEKNKYFYVWLDAPIGYIATFKNLCKRYRNIDFNEFWHQNSDTELYHFIGKDIIYFHSLFWPAILEGSQFRKPTHIFVHGYVTINGSKMSKSRGNFITARNWLTYLDSDSLRYYYATKLSSNIDDIDVNLQDFIQRINTDIVNKIVNLASRNARFLNKYFQNKLAKKLESPKLYNSFVDSSKTIEIDFMNRDYSQVIRKIRELADLANSYIDQHAPWIVAKQQGYNIYLQEICSMGINLFRILMTWLKPIMPSLAYKVENFLNIELLWDDIYTPLLDHTLSDFKILYQRINIHQVNSVLASCIQ